MYILVTILYYCKQCGGLVEYNKNIQLMCSPPKYSGTCKDCGCTQNAYCHEVDAPTGLTT